MKILALMLIVLSFNTFACIGRVVPNIENLSQYSKIFIGQVDYVEIIEREDGIEIAGDSVEHNLELSIVRVIKGDLGKSVTLKGLQGCGLPIPRYAERGIFFVIAATKEDAEQVIPIYEYDEHLYEDALQSLGIL